MVKPDLCPLSPHFLELLTAGGGCILGRQWQRRSDLSRQLAPWWHPLPSPSMSPPLLPSQFDFRHLSYFFLDRTFLWEGLGRGSLAWSFPSKEGDGNEGS